MLRTLLLFLLALITFPAHARGRLTSSSIDRLVGDASLVSVKGRAIEIYSVSTEAAHPGDDIRFLIEGGLHGNEILTTEFVNWLRDRLVRGVSPLSRLDARAVFDLVPVANPDAAGLSRYNARNVNLNRNFGVNWGKSREPAGKDAFSEPETRALKALLANRKYVAAADVHGYVNWIVMPSFPASPGGPAARFAKWNRAIEQHAGLLSRVESYEIRHAMSLGDGGAFEDWAFWGNGSLAFCLEMATASRFTGEDHQTDSFLVYEEFLFAMFQEAMKLDATPLVNGWSGP